MDNHMQGSQNADNRHSPETTNNTVIIYIYNKNNIVLLVTIEKLYMEIVF